MAQKEWNGIVQIYWQNEEKDMYESYTQWRAPTCLHREEMPPFPLALGFNAAIPPRSRVGRTLSDALHSLPFWRVFTSRSFMKYSKVRQTVRGIGRGAANTRASNGKMRCKMRNRSGYFCGKCYLEILKPIHSSL